MNITNLKEFFMKKHIFLAILAFSFLYITKANAQVVAFSVPGIAVEDNKILIRGFNLDSTDNPLKVTATNSSGSVINLDTKLGKNKIWVTMPTVANDTKILLSVSGGNVSNSDAQVFVVLVIDKPNEGGGTSSNDDFGDDDNDGSDDDTTPPGIARLIQDLPNLEFIGSGDIKTVVRGDLQVRDALTVGGDTKINGTLTADHIEGNLSGTVVYRNNGHLNLEVNGNELADNTKRSLDVTNKNLFHLTNTGTDHLAALTGAVAGQKVLIIFDATVVIDDNDNHAANSLDIDGTTTVFGSDTSLELVYDGISWYETSRSTN